DVIRAAIRCVGMRPGISTVSSTFYMVCRPFRAGESDEVVLSFTDATGVIHRRQGELMVTGHGLEGGLIYALSTPLREAIALHGQATIQLDLVPGRTLERLTADLARPRGAASLAKHLKARAGIEGVKAGLLREALSPAELDDPARLARTLKSLPLTLTATRPIDEAISTAGGIMFDALDEQLMLRGMPGVFCAGEMLDWEAPTGGYLLTACFASGRATGLGALRWLQEHRA
ncbi:MAG TPA: TIGR03862 family flavoprotein, partial [Chromatiales bacterium]|nr:TIGR03862 family flavoprotein [Chromatiales bacterium]